MKKIKLFQADAFTDKLFAGNPAGVCPLDEWLPENTMQSIAAENNVAETAFIVPKGDAYEIRWFTPAVEVALCGHATLATAYVLFNCLDYQKPEIVFHSLHSGVLRVTKKDETLFLDFPTDTLEKCDIPEQLVKGIGIVPHEMYKGKTDYIAVVSTEEEVRNLKLDFKAINTLEARGLIVTAKGNEVDFVSRFFGPQVGIDEDPVTGSAHTSLTPIWSEKLGKKELTAKQLSKRGGSLICVYHGERVLIGGKAKLYFKGEVELD
ncbi:MAG: PhzF family phenazine biosynthesis protein [Bacteroidales bacterium]|nr:PhzF family phenazine biosynthesis protein [Bacteroidales bacterium]